MKEYKDVRSTVKPNSIEIKPEKVYTYTDIREETETIEDVNTTMYVYDMTEYDKDEFIGELFTQVGESQQAIAKVYARLIISGNKKIGDVPLKIRNDVKQALVDFGHPELAVE